MSTGLDAACRRFPSSIGQIEILIRQNEEFSELCNDLAAAETALITAKSGMEPVRWARISKRSADIARCYRLKG